MWLVSKYDVTYGLPKVCVFVQTSRESELNMKTRENRTTRVFKKEQKPSAYLVSTEFPFNCVCNPYACLGTALHVYVMTMVN